MRNVETIGSVDELEDLSIEYRRVVAVACQPGCRVDDEFHADQAQLAVRGPIDQRLRFRGVKLGFAQQSSVDVVDAHGSAVRISNASICSQSSLPV